VIIYVPLYNLKGAQLFMARAVDDQTIYLSARAATLLPILPASIQMRIWRLQLPEAPTGKTINYSHQLPIAPISKDFSLLRCQTI
jgi:hypothetical protein